MAVTLILLAAVATATPQPPVERVVAVVEKTVVTTAELDFWAFELRLRTGDDPSTPLREYHRLVLTRHIDLKLLSGWAEMLLEKPADGIVDVEFAEAMQELEKLAGGPGRLAQQLEDSQLDPDEFRVWVREKERQEFLAAQALMAYANLGGTGPLDGELREADRLRLAHILVADPSDAGQAKALRIRRDVEAGLPFAQAARLYSDDSATAERGGDLGWLAPADLDSSLWKAAVNGTRFASTEPVKTGAGWHLLMVLELETPRTREWQLAMRSAEDRELVRLRRESDIRLAEGFELRKIELPKTEQEGGPWPD